MVKFYIHPIINARETEKMFAQTFIYAGGGLNVNVEHLLLYQSSFSSRERRQSNNNVVYIVSCLLFDALPFVLLSRRHALNKSFQIQAEAAKHSSCDSYAKHPAPVGLFVGAKDLNK